MAKLFWYLAQTLDLNPWFEIVGTDYNPADMPTRHVALPFPVDKSIQFTQLTILFQLIQKNSRLSTARRIKEAAITTPR